MTDNPTDDERKTAARLFGRLPARPEAGEDIPEEERTFLHEIFGTDRRDRTPFEELLAPTPTSEES